MNSIKGYNYRLTLNYHAPTYSIPTLIYSSYIIYYSIEGKVGSIHGTPMLVDPLVIYIYIRSYSYLYYIIYYIGVYHIYSSIVGVIPRVIDIHKVPCTVHTLIYYYTI